MQPPRYYSSADNIVELKQYEKAKVFVTSLGQSVHFDASCRLMGNIEPADGLTIPQFITKALNDELKMAGLYDTKGIKLSGSVTKIGFSSIEGLTDGYWDLGLQIDSANGESLLVQNTYKFPSGFDGITACNATANALTPAVQDLLKVLITHPKFSKLIQ